MSQDNIVVEQVISSPTQAPEAAPIEAPEAVEATKTAEPQVSEQAEPQQSQDNVWEARMQEFVKREGQWQEERAAMKAELAQAQALNEAIKSGSLDELTKVGLNIDDIVNKTLGMEPEVDPVKQTQEELKAQIEALKEAEQRRQQEAEQANISKWKSSVSDLVKANPEKFEICSLLGQDAIEQAYTVLEHEFNKSNGEKLLSQEEALQVVEDHYLQMATNLAKAKKILGNSEPQVEASKEVEAKPSPAKTLTQQVASNAPRTSLPFEMQVEESKKAAADLLKWI